MRCSALLVAVLIYACGAAPSPAANSKEAFVFDAVDAPADLLIRVRKVITLADGIPADADTIAIRDGRITAVGSVASLASHVGPATQRVEWPDSVAVPGLVDSHAHLTGLGASLSRLDLRGTSTIDEIVAEVRAADFGGGWVVGRGWDQNNWLEEEFPTHAPLTEALPNHPVALTRIDGHAIWVNAKAMQVAGVTAETPEPVGGRIVRDANGQPTGVFVDEAMSLIRDREPPPSRAQIRRWIERAITACHRVGLTGVHDAGASAEQVEIYRELAKKGDFGLRVHVMLAGDDPEVARMIAAGPVRDSFVDVVGVKYFADGALGSRGAWLLEPYADAPDTSGIAGLHGEALVEKVEAAAAQGFQVGVHAIGDAAARDVMDAYSAVLAAGNDRRFRIEHAQVVHPDDQARMAALGVLALVQPTHATSDMDWAERRLGPQRVRYAYAWRSLRNAGVRLALGSDFPVERPNPTEGLFAAVARVDAAGEPKGGWYAGEALTAEEALRGFTVDAAYAGFREATRGRIALGYDADITILGGDPLTVSPAQLRVLPVKGVVVAGRVVYRAP